MLCACVCGRAVGVCVSVCVSVCVPGIFRCFSINVICSFFSYDVQCIFLFVVINDLPVKKKILVSYTNLAPMPGNLPPQTYSKVHLSILPGCVDIDGSFQFLFTVIVKVHQFILTQDKPAHLPVPPRQRARPSTFFIQPATLHRVLL